MPTSAILTGHRVVSFDQSASFFQRRARRHLDRMNYISALGCLRRAVAKEPTNSSFWLDIAETYTEMSCFDESNHILFYLAQTDGANECFFGMGCNFLGLQEYEKARESFLTYLRLEPEGLYSEDVEDLLDAMEEQVQPMPFVPPRVQLLAMRGKHALDQGDAARARRYLEKALQHDPSLHHVRNNLSLALYCEMEYSAAIAETLRVLHDDPDNLNAYCALAMALHARGDTEASEKAMERALSLHEQTPGDIGQISLMLAELGRHEQALKKFLDLRMLRPYDLRVLHCLAAAHANCGHLPAAIRIWARMGDIDPDNTIALYYMTAAEEAFNAGQPFTPSYTFQVPHEEALQRIRRINEFMTQGLDALRERWQNDTELRRLILWGLSSNDVNIKRALLTLVASFKDVDAERILRMYLGRRDEPDSLKRDVFGMLKQMQAPEPYIAYLDDAIVEVRVNLIGAPLKLPAEYETVLMRALSRMAGRYSDPYSVLAHIWTAYVHKNEGRLPRISRPDGWAAALEYVYCLESGIDVPITELCRRHHTSPRTLRMIALRLFDALETNPLPKEE